jgi:hypothetical protein
MKKYLAMLVALCLLQYNVRGQVQVEEVSKALQKGDFPRVAAYFDKVVVLTINDEQSTYSKSQAEMVLKTFAGKHHPRNFQLQKKGTAPSDQSIWFIGELITDSGSFKVYIFFKYKNGQYVLQELRLEQ